MDAAADHSAAPKSGAVGSERPDFLTVWQEDEREMMLECDEHGILTSLDPRAEYRLGVGPGVRFVELVPEGTQDKARALLQRAAAEPVRDSELSLVVRGKVVTYSFCAKPNGRGGVFLLATTLPEDFGRALGQISQAMDEAIELNRQISRQTRELLLQKEELERINRELDESHRGVVALHEELLDKADTVRRTAEVKARVVTNVSHEFRTPLHTILGLSKLLLDGTDGPLSEEQQKQIRYIRTSAQDLSALVNDLLDLSKAESGKLQLRPSQFLVADFFAAMRGMLRPLVPPESQVELHFDAPPAPITLESDQGKVAQILRNLVSNALKFTEHGEVRVAAYTRDGNVVFTVHDTGIGIAPEHLDRIFEEFGQIESPIQARVKGTGLGLSLSRRLAEVLGGTLTVESQVGVGSTFTLIIPCVHPEVSEIKDLSTRPLDPAKAPVLVVEDDRKTIFVYEKYLALAGFQVLPARTIEDAKRVLRTTRPAAIVLDIMLEGETSWEFLSELKKNPQTRDIPVLVVTVTNREQKARALGADEFWLKPIDQDRLLRKLRSIQRSGSGTKVLVIDDDEKSRYLLRKILEHSAFTLIEAESGPEGIRQAREARPNIILLDFLLQDMTAFDVLDDLKADGRTRNIPVIIITSQILAQKERARLAAETAAILNKDSLSRELAINRIRDALHKAGVGTTQTPGE
jgi:signal transduction histidine kinase/CheY-like chemotaxis protein